MEVTTVNLFLRIYNTQAVCNIYYNMLLLSLELDDDTPMQ